MKKSVILIHGWAGHGNYFWLPDLKEDLEKSGITVFNPNLPNPKKPVYNEWKSALIEVIKQVPSDHNIGFVAHSMGGYLIMRIIGENSEDEWVKRIIAVVLVGSSATKRPEYMALYDDDINFENIKVKLVCIWSRDDPRIKEEHSKLITEKMNGKYGYEYIELEGYEHFCIPKADVINKKCLELFLD